MMVLFEVAEMRQSKIVASSLAGVLYAAGRVPRAAREAQPYQRILDAHKRSPFNLRKKKADRWSCAELELPVVKPLL
jgi:hypothetical protein